MPAIPDIRQLAKELQCCAVIPTYNNAHTLRTLISDVSLYISDIIVVNDGATDETPGILAGIEAITAIGYSRNRGKGYALRQGFKRAVAMGFRYAVTIDSDGQHRAGDIVLFLDMIRKFPDSLVVGSRILRQANMPSGNTFANRFSNFWFRLQTGISLPDTQSGFRLYPLKKMARMRFVTNRYESELEMLVRSAWKGIRVCEVAIAVYYPPKEERISHFRPFMDFFRISILNTFFTIFALVYIFPVKLFAKFSRAGRWAKVF